MPQLILHINREDQKSTESEYRNAFIRETLVNILSENEINELWPASQETELSVQQRISLKEFLAKYNINIIAEGRETKIYVDKELTAHFKIPRYIMRQDPGQIDPLKRLYYEMIIDYYSVFEIDETE